MNSSALAFSVERALASVQRVDEYTARATQSGREFQEAGARAFSYSIARIEAAVLLIEHAAASGEPAAMVAAERWCARELAVFVDADASHRTGSRLLTGLDSQV